MPDSLQDIICTQIRQDGPMSVAHYMGLCLSHPVHGYYMKKDPFGQSGDFVTAPEVSQLFGEMLGVWAADIWMQMGSPEAFVLLECGPGRGTLMADMLRATRHVKGFHEAAKVHLLEISPVLRDMQKSALGGYEVAWCEGLDDAPDGLPYITIGNEFLDALPFQSLQKTGDGWVERVITLDDNGALCFGLRPISGALSEHIPFHLRGAQAGSVYEISPARQSFASEVGRILSKNKGAALFIDYGHGRSGYGDTFQALKNNKRVDVFESPGDEDLTSHVDFEALVQDLPEGVQFHGPITQALFLKGLGIEQRAQALRALADEKQGADLEKGLQRLVSSDQMGELFKVIVLSAS